MIVKLLTEHHLECLSLKGDCRGSSESTHVKMPHCWKSHALPHNIMNSFGFLVDADDVDLFYRIKILTEAMTLSILVSNDGYHVLYNKTMVSIFIKQ